MEANIKEVSVMTYSPTAIALIAVLVIGYLAAVGLGTAAYFANEKNY